MKKRCYLLLLFSILLVAPLHAEEENTPEAPSSVPTSLVSAKRTRGFFGTIGYLLNDLDTNYVRPNHYIFTVMLENSIWHENYRISGTDGQTMRFTPNTSYKLGPYIGWSFIFLGWSMDLKALFNNVGSDSRTEFSLNVYSSIVGGDLFFRKTDNSFRLHSLNGFGDDMEEFDEKVNGFSVDIKGANVYYVFNHRRFSYPAAYSQSTNQRRSAGSMIAGFSYSNHKLKMEDYLLPDRIRDSITTRPIDFDEVHYSDYSLSLGYAYNWVFAKNCLMNVSAAPALAYKHSQLKTEEESTPVYHKLNLDFVARAAATWNNGKYYFGASWVYNSFGYRTKKFNLLNGFGIARFYAGFNFGLKKQYRKK